MSSRTFCMLVVAACVLGPNRLESLAALLPHKRGLAKAVTTTTMMVYVLKIFNLERDLLLEVAITKLL